MWNASGPVISTVPFTGSARAASATAVATSSAAIGWNSECDSRTVSPSTADCAMPRRNSKNWVARTIVYGIGEPLNELLLGKLGAEITAVLQALGSDNRESDVMLDARA